MLRQAPHDRALKLVLAARLAHPLHLRSLRNGWAREVTPVQAYDCFSIVYVVMVPCSLS
jgi:hypothetical protein